MLGRSGMPTVNALETYTVFTGVICWTHLCNGPENGTLYERCTRSAPSVQNDTEREIAD
jgi:hypothetical protein